MPPKNVRRRVSFSVPQQSSDSESESTGITPAVTVVVEDSVEGADGSLVPISSRPGTAAIGRDDRVSSDSDSGSSRSSDSDSDSDSNSNSNSNSDSDSDSDGVSHDSRDKSVKDRENAHVRLGSDNARGSGSDRDNNSDCDSTSNSNSSSDSDSDSSSHSGGDSDSRSANSSSGSDSGRNPVSKDAEAGCKDAPGPAGKATKSVDPLQTEGMPASAAEAGVSSFAEMMLDKRVSWAIAKLGWRRPTPVQKATIPAALAGRDVLVAAPTGSGKTAAYAVPLANQLCQAETARGHTFSDGATALVLVPTRELASQVAGQIRKVLKFVQGARVTVISAVQADGAAKTKSVAPTQRHGRVLDGGVAGDSRPDEPKKGGFMRTADVLVGTPAAVASIQREHGDSALARVSFVVVDEADLVLSFGHGTDARTALAAVPSTAQAMLVSATLDVEGLPELQKIVLRRPLTVKVTATPSVHPAGGSDGAIGPGAVHYFAQLKSALDRYLVMYVMLRLNVISGKVLIFTNGINSSFRLKLFLDQFKIKCAVLNSELPANSRVHCVEQFNAGIFDVLIATDEIQRDDGRGTGREEKEGEDGDVDDKMGHDHNGSVGGKRKRNRDGVGKKGHGGEDRESEFGVSRGVDFRGVAAVVNFDVPGSNASYTHRAGRTARAGASGTVLSLPVGMLEQKALESMAKSSGMHIGPLSFRMDQIEAFRYRVEDCLRAITDTAVRDARLAEVRREMVNSNLLKEYFEDNPLDLDALKHDSALAKDVPEHLARVPGYLLPPALRNTVSCNPVQRSRRGRVRNHGGGGKRGGGSGKAGGDDPLKTFSSRKAKGTGTSRDRYKAKHVIGKKKGRKGTGGKKRTP